MRSLSNNFFFYFDSLLEIFGIQASGFLSPKRLSTPPISCVYIEVKQNIQYGDHDIYVHAGLGIWVENRRIWSKTASNTCLMYIFRKPVHNRFVDDVKTGLETETKVSTNAVYREPVCIPSRNTLNTSSSGIWWTASAWRQPEGDYLESIPLSPLLFETNNFWNWLANRRQKGRVHQVQLDHESNP